RPWPIEPPPPKSITRMPSAFLPIVCPDGLPSRYVKYASESSVSAYPIFRLRAVRIPPTMPRMMPSRSAATNRLPKLARRPDRPLDARREAAQRTRDAGHGAERADEARVPREDRQQEARAEHGRAGGAQLARVEARDPGLPHLAREP